MRTEKMENSSVDEFSLTESLSKNLDLKCVNNLDTSRTCRSEPIIHVPSKSYNTQIVSPKKSVIQQSYESYFKQDEDGDTQLHISISMGYVTAACWLINQAVHSELLDIQNDDWNTALHYAVLMHQPEIVRHLVIAGANPLIRTYNGNTALHIACKSADVISARALTEPLSNLERYQLQPGKTVPCLPPNLELRDYDGQMCIHIAATLGNVDLMRVLLRAGANLEAQEAKSGQTALHIAVAHRHIPLLHFLLWECKPQIDAITYGHLTAYQIAMCIHDTQMAVLLLRFGAEPISPPESSEDSDDSMELL